tara:strand:+ start:1795 stop:2019 length:225 start_codon:yes stop_codon:yes gene_type:complete
MFGAIPFSVRPYSTLPIDDVNVALAGVSAAVINGFRIDATASLTGLVFSANTSFILVWDRIDDSQTPNWTDIST